MSTVTTTFDKVAGHADSPAEKVYPLDEAQKAEAQKAEKVQKIAKTQGVDATSMRKTATGDTEKKLRREAQQLKAQRTPKPRSVPPRDNTLDQRPAAKEGDEDDGMTFPLASWPLRLITLPFRLAGGVVRFAGRHASRAIVEIARRVSPSS